MFSRNNIAIGKSVQVRTFIEPTSVLIELLMASGLDILELARPRGFEPLTSASGGSYSSENIIFFNA
jgi:hypothetical protein